MKNRKSQIQGINRERHPDIFNIIVNRQRNFRKKIDYKFIYSGRGNLSAIWIVILQDVAQLNYEYPGRAIKKDESLFGGSLPY